MGIPLYFKKITHEFTNIVSDTKPKEEVSRLFLDFNCAIHFCSNQIKSKKLNLSDGEFEEKLIHDCKKYILHLKEHVQPHDLVYVSIDGIVPMAKISQQRKRRFFSDLKNKNSKEWNSNAITPGTKFMKKLIEELESFSRAYDFKIIIDAERGEGEHKICHFIRKEPSPKGLDVVYGMDADMILLTMLSKHSDHTYLLREHVQDPTSLIYMSINNTKQKVYEQFSTFIHDKSSSKEFLIHCYIVLTFFLGNDFLPNLSYISLRSDGLSHLLEAYKQSVKETNEHILDESMTKLNDKFMQLFIMKLSNKEDHEFYEQEKAYYKYHYSNRRKNDIDEENYPIENKFPKVIKSNEEGWRQNYYYYLFLKSSDTSIINSVCKKYVQGFEWLISYYFKQETEWFWFYPYNYSPTIMDLSNYIMITDISIIDLETKYTHDIQSIDQLIMVLPPSSIDLLPDESSKKIMRDTSYGCGHLFPIQFDICTFMKYRLHECGSQGLFLQEPVRVERILAQ
jgi:5'-3' exonuclease